MTEGDWLLFCYAVIGLLYGVIWGLDKLSSLRAATFVGVFWPLALVRSLAAGAREWWKNDY